MGNYGLMNTECQLGKIKNVLQMVLTVAQQYGCTSCLQYQFAYLSYGGLYAFTSHWESNQLDRVGEIF